MLHPIRPACGRARAVVGICPLLSVPFKLSAELWSISLTVSVLNIWQYKQAQCNGVSAADVAESFTTSKCMEAPVSNRWREPDRRVPRCIPDLLFPVVPHVSSKTAAAFQRITQSSSQAEPQVYQQLAGVLATKPSSESTAGSAAAQCTFR